MKSFLFAAAIIAISSCQNQFNASIQKTNSTSTSDVSEVMDFRAKRLSGSRVKLSWHVESNQNQNGFLVMRKLGKNGVFEKVGIVKSKQSDSVNDYALTDLNECEDSSFYSIMQIDGKGVKYFSLSKGVKGVVRGN